MLNQRLLATLLAVTTVTTAVAVNSSASFANNSTNVQKIAQVDGTDWKTYAGYIKSAIDLYQQAEKWGVVKVLNQFLQEANNMINQGLGSQTVSPNKIANLRNTLKASDFTTPQMKQKLQELKNRL